MIVALDNYIDEWTSLKKRGAYGASKELPDSPAVHYAMALALAAAGRDTEATHWLNRAIGEVPELKREAATDLPLACLGAF